VISLSAVQFSNGFRLDLDALCELRDQHGVLVHLDAIQHLGALVMDVSRHPVDFLSAGGHKWLLGPIGSGMFYCRSSSLEQLRPSVVGYHTVDKPLDHADFELTPRPGAARFEEALVNFPGVYGLDAAIQILLELGPDEVESRVLELTSVAMEGLRTKGYAITSPTGARERSGIVAFRHPTKAAADVDRTLQRRGVDVAVRRDTLRISPSYYNDADEIDRFLRALP
jgi:cysteine desulfurase/selenocysteine lyase